MNVPLAFKVGRKNESKWDLFDRRNRGVSILIVLFMGRFLHAQPSEAASPMRYRILSVTRQSLRIVLLKVFFYSSDMAIFVSVWKYQSEK